LTNLSGFEPWLGSLRCVISKKLIPSSGADPGFFLGGGAPLRNGISDWWGKQILKVNTKKASSQVGVPTPCTLPLDLPLVFTLKYEWVLARSIR